MLMDGLEDVCRVRVKFNEIDSMRRVWHGAYVTYFEDGRESFGRHYPGIGYADMQRSGIYAPIYDLHLRFYAPLVLDDVAVVHTRYVYRPGARLDFEYTVRRMESCARKEVRCSCSSIRKVCLWWTRPITIRSGRRDIGNRTIIIPKTKN